MTPARRLQWRGGQPQLGRREQDRAGRFPGAQPVEWLVIVRGDNQEISGIVCRAVPGRLAGLGKPPGGEVAQKRRVDQANRGWRQAVDRNAIVAPGMAVGPQLQLGRIARGARLGVRGVSHRSSKPFPQCRARHRDNDHANTRSLLLEDVEVT